MISMFDLGFATHRGCDLGVKICNLVRVRPRLVADADLEGHLGRRTQHQRSIGHLKRIIDPVGNQQTGLVEFAGDLEEIPAQGPRCDVVELTERFIEKNDLKDSLEIATYRL